MAGFNYGPISNTAARLIDRFGYSGTIIRDKTTSYPVRIVVSEYQPKDVDGKLIQQNDKRVFVSAKGLPIIPDPERDKLLEPTSPKPQQIVTVTKTAPGGSMIIFELQTRL